MKANFFAILLLLLMCSTTSISQNYLFKKDMGGLSGYFGLVSNVNPLGPGMTLGLNYTFSSNTSIGITRNIIKTESYDDGYKGYFGVNLSGALVKIEKSNTTFSVPLYLGLAFIDGQQLFSYGGSLALRNQMNDNASFTPILSIIRTTQLSAVEDNSLMIYSFEFNIIFQKFRIAPSTSISGSRANFGLAIGFII